MHENAMKTRRERSPHRIPVLLDVHLVARALHREAIYLLAELQDVPLVLPQAS